MRELVALASAVTIDTAVSTPPVYVHPKVAAASGQDRFCINKMHLSAPLCLNRMPDHSLSFLRSN